MAQLNRLHIAVETKMMEDFGIEHYVCLLYCRLATEALKVLIKVLESERSIKKFQTPKLLLHSY